MSNNNLPLLYSCTRTIIEGRDERKKLFKSAREVESEKGCKYHAVYRKKKRLSSPLYVVSSKSEGVPFAEYLMELETKRPLIGVSKEVSSQGVKYHIVQVDIENDHDVVREITVPGDSAASHMAIANMIGSVHLANGVFYIADESISDEYSLILDEGTDAHYFKKTCDVKGENNNSALQVIPLNFISIDTNSCSIKTRIVKHIPIPKTLSQKVFLASSFLLLITVIASTVLKKEEEKQVQLKASKHQEFVDEFAKGYAPKAALYEIYRALVGEADLAPKNQLGLRDGAYGWEVASLELKPERIIVRMKGEANATLPSIRKLAAQKRSASVVVSQSEVAVVREIPASCRTPVLSEALKIPIEGVINYLISSFKLLPQASLDFGKERKMSTYTTRSMVIRLSQVSPETIDLVGTILNFLPIKFVGATFNTTGDLRLMDGTMNFQIIGCGLADIGADGLCR